LLSIALFYVAGILTAEFLALSPWVLLAGSFGVGSAAIIWTSARWQLLCVLLVLTGWSNSLLHTAILSPLDVRGVLGNEPQLATIRGVVRETPSVRIYGQGEQPSWRTLARLEVTAICVNKQSWQPVVGRVAVSTPGLLTNVFAGETVEVFGVAALPRIAFAPGMFDYRAYLREQGIYYQLLAASEADWQILVKPAKPPLAERFRVWAQRGLARGLPREDESLRLEWALTLGWKAALTEEVSEPFVQAATYHIFAVDGLRMAIIFGIFFGLFRAVGLPRPVCGLVLLPLIWFYVALTGWPASAIRASVMLTVVIGGWVLNRPSDILNSLFAAALIILVWQPQQLFQAGFQLSFFVVLCLILMLPPLWEIVHRWTAPDPLLPVSLRRRWPAVILVPARYCGDVLLTSFAAWIGSIPLAAYYFHILTPVSTPANLVAVPLCALVLVSNLSSLLLVGWFPAAAELFNQSGWFLMECIRVSSHWFANWPRAFFYVPEPSLLTIAFYYALLVAILTGWLFRPAWRPWKFTLAGAVTLLCGWNSLRELAVTRLTILPVNGGLSIYCDAAGVRNDWLLDTGTTNSVQCITKPFLRAQGVNRLTTLLMSHGDLHHIGGARMTASLFSARQVCASPVRFRSATYRQTLAHFNQTPGLVRVISRADPVGTWMVLHPDPEDRFPQADDNSLVLHGNIGGTQILLLSDLGRPGQAALLDRIPALRADIVVTGLPAASEAIGDDLLDRVRPRLLIVADSEFPASERARPALCQRLARRNVPVIYTRFEGTTTIELRHGAWSVRTMNGKTLTSETTVKAS
jgi:competence protein ComEC